MTTSITALEKFKQTINAIRDPETGCPWNLEQTHGSLKRYLLEEMYECLEAIDEIETCERSEQELDQKTKAKHYKDLQEELGDLLLQIILHAKMAEEKGYFNFDDVVKTCDDKMIRRHPHVFATAEAKNTAEVDKHWDKVKAAEKAARKSYFEGIPLEMPALARAWKISKKAVKESFEWDEEQKLWDQLTSECDELKEVIENYRQKAGKDPYKEGYGEDEKTKEEAELELGDILFTVVNIARWFKIDPEDALRKTNNKFVNRFNKMTEIAKEQGRNSLKEFKINELEELWQQAKKALR